MAAHPVPSCWSPLTGVLVHLSILAILYLNHLRDLKEAVATGSAMTYNFLLNNVKVTLRDLRLRGKPGL